MRVRYAIIGMVVLAGCSSQETTYPVTGRVYFQDRTPVKSGVIEFSPMDGKVGARSRIDEDGRFTLTTGDRAGALAGEHRIAIVQLVVADGHPSHVHKRHVIRRVHPRYAKFQSSGLSRVVEPRENDFLIVVDPAVATTGW